MSKKYNLTINILIISLIIALVFVMMNYYAGNPTKVPANTDVINENIIPNNNEVIITNNQSNNQTSEDKIINLENSGEQKEEIKENEKTENDAKEENSNKPADNPVIMTSENETSSKEKREILTELDKTLMELLDVVEKVQTIDESRLIIDNSEVQP